MKKNTKTIIQQLHNKWEELQPRDRILLSLLILVVPLFLYTRFIFFPQMKELQKLKEERNRLVEKIKHYGEKQKILEKLKKEEKVINNVLSQALQLLPKKTELSSLLSNIAKQGEKFNIVITQLNLGKEEIIKDFYTRIPLKLNITGSYSNIMLFLDNIRLQKQILSPQIITMIGKDGQVNANCTIYTYRILSEEEIKKIKQQKKQRKK